MLTMPFKPNDELTKKWARMGARKGLVIELAQQQEMTELFSGYLMLASRMIRGEDLTEKELRTFDRLEDLVFKSMDKLHATKESLEFEFEPETLDKINKAIDEIL